IVAAVVAAVVAAAVAAETPGVADAATAKHTAAGTAATAKRAAAGSAATKPTAAARAVADTAATAKTAAHGSTSAASLRHAYAGGQGATQNNPQHESHLESASIGELTSAWPPVQAGNLHWWGMLQLANARLRAHFSDAAGVTSRKDDLHMLRNGPRLPGRSA